jgi:hypothetical protein
MADRYTRTIRERREAYLRVLEARSLATTPERLTELAWDDVPPVRLWASGNPNMPPDVLEALVRAGDAGWALFNPSTLEPALRVAAERERSEQLLAERQSLWVRADCFRHPNASRAFRKELRKQGVEKYVRGIWGAPPWEGRAKGGLVSNRYQ